MASDDQSGVSSRTLDGKLALVTGASRGIGAAICENLASKGCSLIMNFTSQSSAEKTESLASSLRRKHAIRTCVVQADVGSPEIGRTLVSTAKQHLSSSDGRFQVDIIINNAGIAQNQYIEETTIENFHNQYNVNVLGPLLILQAFLPYLPHDRSGRVVNVSSVSSSLGFHAQSIYGGTKAALDAMTRTWSRELADRCTVNAINPGPVATDMYGKNTDDFVQKMIPWNSVAPRAQVSEKMDGKQMVEEFAGKGGRAATSEEIAGIVGMLCSAEASFCTGSVICANGGMRFSP